MDKTEFEQAARSLAEMGFTPPPEDEAQELQEQYKDRLASGKETSSEIVDKLIEENFGAGINVAEALRSVIDFDRE